jgi:transposase-like protein
VDDIHSCSYYCHHPKCIKAQRDELRDMLKSKGEEHLNAFADGWNSALNMAAMRINEIEAFGTTTRDSFAVYIKSLKKEKNNA